MFTRDKDKLFNCVKMKNISQLQRFLDHGLNINITNVNKQSPLHIAAGHSPCQGSLISSTCLHVLHVRSITLSFMDGF